MKSELKLYGLTDAIEPTSETIYSEKEQSDRKNIVKELIINRINANYHNIITNIDDLVVILRTLKERKQIENNISDKTIRQQLYMLKMKPREFY